MSQPFSGSFTSEAGNALLDHDIGGDLTDIDHLKGDAAIGILGEGRFENAPDRIDPGGREAIDLVDHFGVSRVKGENVFEVLFVVGGDEALGDTGKLRSGILFLSRKGKKGRSAEEREEGREADSHGLKVPAWSAFPGLTSIKIVCRLRNGRSR